MTTNTAWRTSSYSGNNNECVELAVGSTQTRIRDTKARDAGALAFSAAPFAAFQEMIKSGRLDRR